MCRSGPSGPGDTHPATQGPARGEAPLQSPAAPPAAAATTAAASLTTGLAGRPWSRSRGPTPQPERRARRRWRRKLSPVSAATLPRASPRPEPRRPTLSRLLPQCAGTVLQRCGHHLQPGAPERQTGTVRRFSPPYPFRLWRRRRGWTICPSQKFQPLGPWGERSGEAAPCTLLLLPALG